jgi:hypothetical protein
MSRATAGARRERDHPGGSHRHHRQLLNTCFPPNQPTPRRLGILASGGLRHFVVDEALVARHAGKAIVALSVGKLDSGTSEIRNWIAAAGALAHRRMRTADYVRCYRSEPGSGAGMAFAGWK